MNVINLLADGFATLEEYDYRVFEITLDKESIKEIKENKGFDETAGKCMMWGAEIKEADKPWKFSGEYCADESFKMTFIYENDNYTLDKKCNTCGTREGDIDLVEVNEIMQVLCKVCNGKHD